jgi:NNP family nitrate/nitrite transporter-like MFS transporter
VQNNFGTVFTIMGIVMIAVNGLLLWVRPIPKGQVGGR